MCPPLQGHYPKLFFPHCYFELSRNSAPNCPGEGTWSFGRLRDDIGGMPM